MTMTEGVIRPKGATIPPQKPAIFHPVKVAQLTPIGPGRTVATDTISVIS